MTTSTTSQPLTLTREHYAVLDAVERMAERTGDQYFSPDTITANWRDLLNFPNVKTRAEHEAKIPGCEALLRELESAGYIGSHNIAHIGSPALYYYGITNDGSALLNSVSSDLLPAENYDLRVAVNPAGLTRRQVASLEHEMESVAQQAVDEFLARKVAEIASA